MMLKTVRAPSMAEALTEVKKELGPDAVILHTRSFKVGGLLGMGGRQMVEITASDGRPDTSRLPAAAIEAKPTPRPRVGAVPTPNGTYAPARPGRPTDVAGQIAADLRADLARDIGSAAPVSPRNAEPETPLRHDSRPAPRHFPPPAAPARGDALSNGHTPAEIPARDRPHSATFAVPSPAPARADSALESELAAVKKMLGQVLQSTRQTAVTVGRQGAPGVGVGSMPEPLFELYARLLDHDVSAEIAEELAGAVRNELTGAELADAQIVRTTMLRHIEALIPVKTEPPAAVRGKQSGPRVIALLGPTGVGKTTTVAKLAATYKLRYGFGVGLITSDTYRIAAVEQLRTYASIIGLPIEVVTTAEEMRAAREKLADREFVFVDTAGRSQNDSRRLGELSALLDAAGPHERHLVLGSSVGEVASARVAEKFGFLAPDRIILTKLDEAVCLGPILGLSRRVGLPYSYLTTGQEVPDHLEPAKAERLARLVLDGPPGSGEQPPPTEHRP